MAERTEELQDFYKKNEEKLKRERKSSLAKCVFLFWDKTKKAVDYKLFPHKQDAMKWIHEPQNRELLEDYYPFVHTLGVPEDTGELKITDLMVFEMEVINPSTGLLCATQKVSFDTGADVASIPYHPNFKQLIHGTMHINDSARTIVYAQLRIKGKLIEEIFPIEIETDEEWGAFGLGQMEKLGTEKKMGIMQKITNILIQR